MKNIQIFYVNQIYNQNHLVVFQILKGLEHVHKYKFYKDEIKSYPHSRSIKSIISLSNYRGVQSGFKNAEAFQIIKFSK
jgi:hypothetical protein